MKVHLATWPPEKQIEQTLGQTIAHEVALKTYLVAPGSSLGDKMVESDFNHFVGSPLGEIEEKGQGEGMRLRILLSYWYYKDTDLDALFAKYFKEPYPAVFADSGAYSAVTQGAPINIHEYAAWVKRFKHLFTVYANLDEIGDAAGTWRNQNLLQDKYDLSPLPVFHGGEDFSYLERYLELYNYIALGGVAGGPGEAANFPFFVKCFKLNQGRAGYHGFGVTSWKALLAFPWYSVDSSSWGQGFRFGSVPVFNPVRGRWYKLDLGGRKWFEPEVAKCVRSYGFDPGDFADRARNDRTKICALSALSYMKAEVWLRRRHGLISLPQRPVDHSHLSPEENGPGVKHFFVVGEGSSGKNLNSTTNMGVGAISIMHNPETEGLKIHLAESTGATSSNKPTATPDIFRAAYAGGLHDLLNPDRLIEDHSYPISTEGKNLGPSPSRAKVKAPQRKGTRGGSGKSPR